MYPTQASGIYVGDVYVHEPGSLITNIFIMAWAVELVWKMRKSNGSWMQSWRMFLLCLGFASFGGLFTHGFPLLLSEQEFFIVWGLKNSFIPIGNCFASVALFSLLFSKSNSTIIRTLRILLVAKALLVASLLFVTHKFTPVVIDLAITYIIAIWLNARMRNSIEGADLLLFAFIVAFASGFLYLFSWHIHPHWLTNSDVVHLFVLLSMWLICKGAIQVDEYLRLNEPEP